MKLSYKAEYQKPIKAPVNNWEPVDFLTNSLVDITQNQETENADQAGNKEKKVRDLSDVIALLRLPIVDVPRYKKVIHSEDFDKHAVPWVPKFLSADEDIRNQVLFPGVVHRPDEELSEDEITRRSEIYGDFEKKIAESEEKIHQAQDEAATIINQANEQKAGIIAEAEAMAQQIKQKAHEEGLLSAKVENEHRLQQIITIINETQKWQSRVWEQSEDNIIKSIQTIAKKLFGSGYSLDASSVEQMVGRAINEANRLGNLRIYVNPEDHDQLISLWQESDLVVNGQKIQLVPSQNIHQGGCFVEGEYGSVDSRIDVQLELLENELNHTLTSRKQENQRQATVGPMENLNFPSAEMPSINLSALDDSEPDSGIRNETPENIPEMNGTEEDHGNDIPAQPE